MKRCCWFFSILLTHFSFSVSAASFDCAKAVSRTETTICQSQQLSKLDDDLAAIYRSAYANQSAKAELDRQQKLWLEHSRDPCPDEACLAFEYTQRIVRLKELALPANRQSLEIAVADAAQEDRNPPPGSIPSEPVMPQVAASTPAAVVAVTVPVVQSSSLPAEATTPPDKSNQRPLSQRLVFLLIVAIAFAASTIGAYKLRKRGMSRILSTSIGLLVFIAFMVGVASIYMQPPNHPSNEVSSVSQNNKLTALTMKTKEVEPAPPMKAKEVEPAPRKSTAVFKVLEDIKFGQSSGTLDSSYVRQIRTPKDEELQTFLRARLGTKTDFCFVRAGAESGDPSYVISRVTLCFDAATDKLVYFVLGFSKPSPETPGIYDLKRHIDKSIGHEGRPGEKNGIDRTTDFHWQRNVGGVESSVRFNAVPGGTIYREEVAGRYVNNQLRRGD